MPRNSVQRKTKGAATVPKNAPSPVDRAEGRMFIQNLSALIVPMGMPPIAARIQGYLMLSKDALTLDELAAGLGISKSSASVSARLLERYGIIRRLSEPGTKRVRYEIAGHSAGFLAEQAQFLGAMSNLLEGWAAANPRGEVSARMKDMSGFYLNVRDAIEKVIRDNSPARPK